VVDAGVPLPSKVDLPIYRGDSINAPFRLYSTPDGGVTKNYWDLTGYTGHAQVRRNVQSADVLLELTVTVADPQTGSDKGRVTVTADGVDTTDLPVTCAVWDLELANGADVRTWLRGEADITGDVTVEPP